MRPPHRALFFACNFYNTGRIEYERPTLENLPVAVIGGGPVGLAAAAHLIARGLPVKLYEAGPAIGANLRDWGHVRVFTPWRYCLDTAATALLERHGWRVASGRRFPDGGRTSRRLSRTAGAQRRNSPP